MNITLSADKEMLERSRECAARRGMSLNGMFRDFLKRVVAEPTREDAADDFARLARDKAGRSEAGFRFDRDAAHDRRG